jgi:hypothetical protein
MSVLTPGAKIVSTSLFLPASPRVLEPPCVALFLLTLHLRRCVYCVQLEPQDVPYMPVVDIEPTNTHPIPFDTEDEVVSTFAEEVAVAANTAEMQIAMGAPLEVDEQTAEKEKTLIEQAIRERKSKNLTNPNTAFAAAAFLRTYGQQMALDVAQARAAITNKLMELANCGDPRYELKALEMLGKHSDIGLFTERSEITINYKNPEDLEHAIRERVKRLLNADIIDVTSIGADLDEQLGVAEAPHTALMDELDTLDEVDEVEEDSENSETTQDDDSPTST